MVPAEDLVVREVLGEFLFSSSLSLLILAVTRPSQ